MTRSGWLRRIWYAYRPSRSLIGAFVLLLVVTGTVQQSLDSYARALLDRHLRQSTASRAAPAPVNTLPDQQPLAQNGNRTSVSSGGVVTTYQVDDADQLTALLDNTNTIIQSYSSDAYGNRTASGPNSYSYDWNNQLSSATVSGATVTSVRYLGQAI